MTGYVARLVETGGGDSLPWHTRRDFMDWGERKVSHDDELMIEESMAEGDCVDMILARINQMSRYVQENGDTGCEAAVGGHPLRPLT